MGIDFDIEFLEEALVFLNDLNENERRKVIYNIDKLRFKLDPVLFKKLTSEIWELRTLYNSKCFRIFAFWYNADQHKKLIIATHGIIKKSNKTPRQEIERSERIRNAFIKAKSSNKQGS
jgi:phage-related protein